MPVLRGTMIGSLLGILPGGGAVLSSFASYTIEKKLSKTPEKFGTGAIPGLAGPETANNAGAQTSFIPMLSLGIPSNPVMALILGALVIQGIVPGPNTITQNPDLFWGLVVSMWLGNVMLVVLNLPLIGLWTKLLKVPAHVLFPFIVAFATIGVLSVANESYDIYVLAAFAFIGYFLSKFDCEPAPLLLGFILGPMFEEHMRRSLIISLGDPTIFITRPISAALLALSVLFIAGVCLPNIARRRNHIFSED
jgi:TctA family transporter